MLKTNSSGESGKKHSSTNVEENRIRLVISFDQESSVYGIQW